MRAPKQEKEPANSSRGAVETAAVLRGILEACYHSGRNGRVFDRS
jgi:hypothetical protein